MTTAKRKKSSRKSREFRIAAILEAARDIFIRDGYENATVADIAKHVNIVEGTVFHYFGSKQGLVVKVMEHFYNEITGNLIAGLSSIKGSREQLRFAIRYHLKTLLENAELCRVLFKESRGARSELIDDIRRLNREYIQPLNRIIEEGIQSGELRASVNPLLIRNVVYGSIEHLLWSHLFENRTINVEQSTEEICSILFDGIL
ncbi:MAG: TetR/AcrR family transcriptional regulator [Calditrichota bacterium]